MPEIRLDRILARINGLDTCYLRTGAVKNIAWIGIGSNVGDKVGNCQAAIDRLNSCRENRVLRCSSLYRTEPVGYLNQDWFINCVVRLETALGPEEFLSRLKNLEKALGRKKTFTWGPRVIDLDILLFNREKLSTQDLQIPHPRLHERAFVLVPLCEIDPEAVHPGLKKTASRLLADLGKVEGVEKI
ncbi:MAG: 2-amino-4-hydroxy-6-hydroxymethyldihydropteridine diphosphokinase [Deltaproteobacteria bacterium]|nr:2-amino-4-hydroxy-6-hydroxymethyldihydropteridine diphosphokinase [Deltaproteobacteria bacterium]